MMIVVIDDGYLPSRGVELAAELAHCHGARRATT